MTFQDHTARKKKSWNLNSCLFAPKACSPFTKSQYTVKVCTCKTLPQYGNFWLQKAIYILNVVPFEWLMWAVFIRTLPIEFKSHTSTHICTHTHTHAHIPACTRMYTQAQHWTTTWIVRLSLKYIRLGLLFYTFNDIWYINLLPPWSIFKMSAEMIGCTHLF